MVLFDNPLVGRQLRRFALLAPMLYVDAVTDANVKGMGQQVACVRYNTVTSFLDVVFLWLLLPRFGLDGYYLSFLVTHALNFGLSFFRLRNGHRLPDPTRVPVVLRALGAASLSLWVASSYLKLGDGAACSSWPPVLQCLFPPAGAAGGGGPGRSALDSWFGPPG